MLNLSMRILKLIVLFFGLYSLPMWSQKGEDSLSIREKTIPFFNLDTTQFVKNDISTLNSFSLRDLREIPGYVEIITQDEIQAMGAKDVIEVLNMISGISLGRDVEDGVGVGLRGLWAQEGKVLVMVNGNPVNDLDYGTYNLGGRMPTSFIQRIEVTLGTGSVKYGGTAALGVINIVLKDRQERMGTWVNVDYSASEGYTSRKSLSMAGNYVLENNYQLAIHLNTTNSLRSTALQPYGRGKQLSWGDSSQVDCNNFFISLKKNRLTSTVFISDFQYNISDQQNSVIMSHFGGDIKWDKKLFKNSQLSLHTQYIDQLPWLDINTSDSSLMNTNTHSNKLIQTAWISTRVNAKFSIDYGIQGYHQISKIIMRGMSFEYNGKSSVHVYDAAAFAEGVYRSKIGVFNFGGRVEYNTFTHLLFAPRVSYSKIIGAIYLKGMYVESYKIPTIQNMNLQYGNDLIHETIKVFDFSIGTNWGVKHSGEISLFHNAIRQPIVYVYDPNQGIDNYMNQSFCGTSGGGFKYYYKDQKTVIKLSGHIYRRLSTSQLSQIESNIDSKVYLGMPNQRYTIQLSRSWIKGIKLQAAGIYQSSFHQRQQTVEWEEPAQYMINLGGQKTFLKNENLEFRLSLSNIFNQRFIVGAATDTDLNVMPLFCRQINFSLQYRMI